MQPELPMSNRRRDPACPFPVSFKSFVMIPTGQTLCRPWVRFATPCGTGVAGSPQGNRRCSDAAIAACISPSIRLRIRYRSAKALERGTARYLLRLGGSGGSLGCNRSNLSGSLPSGWCRWRRRLGRLRARDRRSALGLEFGIRLVQLDLLGQRVALDRNLGGLAGSCFFERRRELRKEVPCALS
jgi:hypothetical protein